jgi:hypothetical protein
MCTPSWQSRESLASGGRSGLRCVGSAAGRQVEVLPPGCSSSRSSHRLVGILPFDGDVPLSPVQAGSARWCLAGWRTTDLLGASVTGGPHISSRRVRHGGASVFQPAPRYPRKRIDLS